jgi:transposase-like protein
VGEVPERAKRRTFTAAYKLAIVAEYEAAPPGVRGEVLRREGLYSSHLTEWRKARDAGALAGLAATRGRPPADPVERDNVRLRERNARLESDLDTARRVIEVQGKVSALLEDLSKRAHEASEAPVPPWSGPSSPPRPSR